VCIASRRSLAAAPAVLQLSPARALQSSVAAAFKSVLMALLQHQQLLLLLQSRRA
jgi:hypothetical protein